MLPRSLAIAAVAIGLLAGCNLAGPNRNYDAELAHYKQVAKTVDHPELTTPPSEHLFTPPPRTIDYNAAPQQPQEWWDMSMDEAIQTAVARSSVLRDLGGTVVRSPDTVRTILGPSIVATDARFGMEAALSEFDATLASSVVADKNDRLLNNQVSSGGTQTGAFTQDLVNFQSQITKTGVAGTRMTLRGLSTYENNNAGFNFFPSVWDSLVEAEIRQPLYQGAGARFNRLAGPNAVPGFYNGVLIARVNTDISVAEFEIGLRDLVSNVENAYWDLYFAFRDLDAKIQARNAALETWNRVRVLVESDQEQGNIEREMQAREQYFRYEEDVQNALAGTLQASTTNNNGSSGGSFRGLGGVLVSERRLRLAIGLPITDGRMIRPIEAPTAAHVTFDWPSASDDAVSRRPELLRQRLAVKRREMEFVAARNFLLPRFDVFGRYRVRGLGNKLIGDADNPPPPPASPQLGNGSLDNLALGDFQEWQLGGEVSLPIGFRRGHAAVRNAQLMVARERAVLEEQERQVIHDLSNALGDVERAYKVMETTYNRRLAASQNVEVIRFRLQSGQPVTPEQLLEGERRLAEADTQYHRALVEHMLAIKNVHFEKGTLLEYGHIYLAEHISVSGARPSPAEPVASPEPEPTPAAPASPEPTPAIPAVETAPAPLPPPVQSAPAQSAPAQSAPAQSAPAPSAPAPSAPLPPQALPPPPPQPSPPAVQNSPRESGGLPPAPAQTTPLPAQDPRLEPHGLPSPVPLVPQPPQSPPPAALGLPLPPPVSNRATQSPGPSNAPPAPQLPAPASPPPVLSGLPQMTLQPPPLEPRSSVYNGLIPTPVVALPPPVEPRTSVYDSRIPTPVAAQPPVTAATISPPSAAPPVERTRLPQLASATGRPLLQWARSVHQPSSAVPANPFPAATAPPPAAPPPAAPTPAAPPPVLMYQLPPPTTQSPPTIRPVEQMGFAGEGPHAARPNDVAVPVVAPQAAPQPAVWQPPVYAAPPALRLPQPSPEPPPVRLPQPAAPPSLDPTQRLPQPAPDPRSENEFQRLPFPG